MLRIDTVRQLTVPTNRSFRLPMGRFSACGGGTIELTCPDKDVAHAIYKAVSWGGVQNQVLCVLCMDRIW